MLPLIQTFRYASKRRDGHRQGRKTCERAAHSFDRLPRKDRTLRGKRTTTGLGMLASVVRSNKGAEISSADRPIVSRKNPNPPLPASVQDLTKKQPRHRPSRDSLCQVKSQGVKEGCRRKDPQDLQAFLPPSASNGPRSGVSSRNQENSEISISCYVHFPFGRSTSEDKARSSLFAEITL